MAKKKITLPQKSVKVIKVDSYDLNTLIESHYKKVNFECQLESANDSYYVVEVEKGVMTRYETDRFNELINSEGCTPRQLRVILKDLANKNVVKAGTYLISVSW